MTLPSHTRSSLAQIAKISQTAMLAASLVVFSAAQAQTVVDWKNGAATTSVLESANWSEPVFFGGSEILRFGEASADPQPATWPTGVFKINGINFDSKKFLLSPHTLGAMPEISLGQSGIVWSGGEGSFQDVSLSLLNNQVWDTGTTSTGGMVGGRLNFGTRALDLQVGTYFFLTPSSFTGSGPLTKSGKGRVYMPSASVAWTSPIDITDGSLVVVYPNGLGSSAVGTTVSGGSLAVYTPILDPAGTVRFTEPLTINGMDGAPGVVAGAVQVWGDANHPVEWVADVTLAGPSRIGVRDGSLDLRKNVWGAHPLSLMTQNASSVMQVGGSLTQDLTRVDVEGLGRTQFLTPRSHTYAGDTRIMGTQLEIMGNEGSSPNSRFVFATNTAAASILVLSMQGGGTAACTGLSGGPAGYALTEMFSPDDTLRIGTSTTATRWPVYEGNIVGPGNLEIALGGTQILNGNGWYGGTTLIEGHLIINGEHTGMGAVTINGGLLMGSGVLAAPVIVQNSGTISGGNNLSGPLLEDIRVGTLNVTNSGNFRTFLRSAGASVVTVSGDVTLAGNLNLFDSGSPLCGTTVILNKLAAGPITGTFAGRPEGQVFTYLGSRYRISYRGGDGNDVTLTKIGTHFADTMAWRAIAGPNSGPGEDFDGDGIKNLMEYALDTHPGDASSGPEAQPYLKYHGPGHISLQFRRHLTRTDLIYEVQWSTDLLFWNIGSRAAAGGGMVSLMPNVTVNDSSATAGDCPFISSDVSITSTSPKLFARLTVRTATLTGTDIAVTARSEIWPDFDPVTNTRRWMLGVIINYINVGEQAATNVHIRTVMGNGQELVAEHSIPLTPHTEAGSAATTTTLDYNVGTLAAGASGLVIVRASVLWESLPGTAMQLLASTVSDVDVNAANDSQMAISTIPLLPPNLTTPLAGTSCSNSQTISGISQPGVSVDVYVDNALRATVTANGTGEWITPALILTAGTHDIHSITRYGGQTSDPSPTVRLIIDPTELADATSLRFRHMGTGVVSIPSGRLDPGGWSIFLRCNTTYEVSIRVCCPDPSPTVTFSFGGTTTTLTDPDGDRVFTGMHTTPAMRVNGAAQLCFTCNLIHRCWAGGAVTD